MLNGNEILLELCRRCVSELAAVRHELRELKSTVHTMKAGEGEASTEELQQPADLTMVAEPSPLADQELAELCAVEDPALRRQLVKALEGGELAVDLATLVKNDGNIAIDAIISAAKGGSVLIFSNVLPSWKRVQELIEEVYTGNPQTENVLVLVPTFRRPSRSLLKAVLRLCGEHRLKVPVQLLHKAILELLGPVGVAKTFDEVELMAAINDMPGVSVHVSRDTELYVDASGCIDQAKAPIPPYNQGDETRIATAAAAGSSEAVELLAAVEAIAQHNVAIRAFSSRSRGQGVVEPPSIAAQCATPPGLTPEAEVVVSPVPDINSVPGNILLTLLGPLRSNVTLSALGLGACSVLNTGACPGVLLWALQCNAAQQRGSAAGGPVQDTQGHQTGAGSSSQKIDQARAKSDVQQPVPPSGESQPALPARNSLEAPPSSGKYGDADDGSGSSAKAVPAHGLIPQGGLPGANEAKLEGDEEKKRSVQAMFIECFRDDLQHERRMLMSQINNLFKMRNQGETLQYKLAGYDKLHDFLVEIPGLALTGVGNRMEVKVGDHPVFEEFCNSILEGADLPAFEKPKPVPESFELQVIKVFRQSGCSEIPARSFRDYWNMVFPDNKLQCKDFGYRDVKGLLANVSVLDRVGGKYNTKYVLKCDADKVTLADNAEGGAPPELAQVVTASPSPAKSPTTPQSPARSQPSDQSPLNRRHSLNVALPSQPQSAGCAQFPGSQVKTTAAASSPCASAGQLPFRSQAACFGMPPPGGPPVLPPAVQQQSSSPASLELQQLQLLQQMQQAQQQSSSPSQQLPPQPKQLPQPHLPSPLDASDPLAASALHGAGSLPFHNESVVADTWLPSNATRMASRLDYDVPMLPQYVRPPLAPRSPAAGEVPPMSLADSSLLPGSCPEGVVGGRSRFGGTRLPYPSTTGGSQALTLDSPTGSHLRDIRRLPLMEETGPNQDDPTPGSGSQVFPTPFARDGSSGKDSAEILDLAVADHKKKRKEKRAAEKGNASRAALFYVSSPGALSSEDRDVMRDQGRFDMGTLCQAQLRTDRNCMIVDFASGRVLFSNQLCNSLFEPMTPLPQKDVADLVHEEERQGFAASLLYLNFGKFGTMEPQVVRIHSRHGIMPAVVTGEQLVGTWWWLDFAPCEQEPQAV